MLKDRKENLLLDSNSTKSLPGGEISHHNNSNKQDGQLEIDFESFDSDIEEDFDEKDDDFDYDEDDGFDDEN